MIYNPGYIRALVSVSSVRFAMAIPGAEGIGAGELARHL